MGRIGQTLIALLIAVAPACGRAATTSTETITGCTAWGMFAILGIAFGLFWTVLQFFRGKQRTPIKVELANLPSVPPHSHDDYVLSGVHNAEIAAINASLETHYDALGIEIRDIKSGQQNIINILMKITH